MLACFFFTAQARKAKTGEPGASLYGKWKSDGDHLPCFETDLEKNPVPWYPFAHLTGTGKMMVLTNQWGSVNMLFVGARGMINISPSTFKSRSGFYPMLQTDRGLYSLIYQELNEHKKITYGIGYTLYEGELHRDNIHLRVKYAVRTAFNFSGKIYGDIEVENLSDTALKGVLKVRSDIWPRKDFPDFDQWLAKDKDLLNEQGESMFRNTGNYGIIFLHGDHSWAGTSKEHTLELSKKIRLTHGATEKSFFSFGVNDGHEQDGYGAQNDSALKAHQQSWLAVLKPVRFPLPEKWMSDECIWSYAQLLSYCFYDPSLQEYIINLGGYGLGSDITVPGGAFGMREIAETSMVLAGFNPALARSSLRWMSKLQLVSGDLPRAHNYTAVKKRPPSVVFNGKFPDESDTEIWYLLAIAEYVKATGDYAFLQNQVEFMTLDRSGTVWEHAKAAFEFIRKYIGTGHHGLIRILNGDWNDYLSKIGSGEYGESMMNTGMLCKALMDLQQIAAVQKDTVFGNQVAVWYDSLKASSDKAFDHGWFLRGYDDHGNPIGGHSDRLFLNAQNWACLGGCGSDEFRKSALRNTLARCDSRIGLTLMSKPYSSPAPDISWAPIEEGEGENAGIWPQTVHWTIWALAEEGFRKEALEEWKKISLRNHTSLFPTVPFGIINGPDCYSSHFAGRREGWTQTGTFNRILEMPMNPMIAWQVFSISKIFKNGNEKGAR
jgi:hypothetical protein